MATPHVAGAYAVLMGAGASIEETTNALVATATDLGTSGNDDLYGDGLIMVSDALDYHLNSSNSGGGADLLSVGDIVISEIMDNPLQLGGQFG